MLKVLPSYSGRNLYIFHRYALLLLYVVYSDAMRLDGAVVESGENARGPIRYALRVNVSVSAQGLY